MSFRVAILALVVSWLGVACGAHPPVDPSWVRRGAVVVAELRWLKKLTPVLPSFQLPEMVEDHDRFSPVELGGVGFDTDLKRIFVGAAVGGLSCLDVADGATIWRFGLDDAVASTPIYDAARKVVYFGADDGRFYAVHARSGRKLWSLEVGAEVRRQVLLANGTLYFATADGTIRAVDPDKGVEVWMHRRQAGEGFTAFGTAGLVFDADGRLITGFADGVVEALDAMDGTVLWSRDLASEALQAARPGATTLYDADATPQVIGDTIIVSSLAGGLFGLASKDGSPRWSRPELDRVSGLASDGQFAYAARSGIGLVAVIPQTGAIRWSRRFATGILVDPVLVGDTLAVSDSEAGLFIVSTAGGDLLQRIDPTQGFFGRATVAHGWLFLTGDEGVLYALAVK